MRRSRKYEEELAVRKRPSAPVDEAAEEPSPAQEALRLQELIGNTNTTAAIARSALQRDAPTAEAAPAKKGEDEKKGGSIVMTMSNGIGTFDLESLNLGGLGSAPREPGKGSYEEPAPKVTELHATKKHDAASSRLMEFATKGKPIDEVKIVMARDGKPYLTVTIKNAHVSNFSVGSDSGEPFDSFSLNFTEVEFEFKSTE